MINSQRVEHKYEIIGKLFGVNQIAYGEILVLDECSKFRKPGKNHHDVDH